MPPAIGEIPTAAQLQQRLEEINNAIVALGEGAPVTYLTVGVPPYPEDPTLLIMPIRIFLEPPITNQETLLSLMNELIEQAEGIEAQLITMGYAPPARSASSIGEEAKVNMRKPRQAPPPLEPIPPHDTSPPPGMVAPPQPEGNPPIPPGAPPLGPYPVSPAPIPIR